MITSLILKRFKDLGITAHEAKCYLSLLEKDSLTAPEVSRIAKIARPNAYEALEKLLSKGFCISKPGKTKKYAAADPSFLKDKIYVEINEELERELNEQVEVSRRNLDKKEQEMLDKKRIASENIDNIVEELKPLYKNSRSNVNPLEYIEIIKDPYQIHKRFMELRAGAKEEILSFTKPPFSVSRKKLDEQVDQEVEILKRRTQITWKSIYEIIADEDGKRWLFKIINHAVRAGEEARVMKELPMKMVIFDSRIVLCTLEDMVSKETSITSQVVEHPALAKSLKILFETLWDQAEDYHILEDWGGDA